VIGNPPFGLRGSLIKDDKPDLKTAEQYFTDTALDKTPRRRPRGHDRPDRAAGQQARPQGSRAPAAQGRVPGRQRMPNTAFEHSHTGVTTDVVFFRKRPDDVAGALDTVDRRHPAAPGRVGRGIPRRRLLRPAAAPATSSAR
jgi:hypothetical protein